MGVSQLRKPESGQDVCSQKNLRIYRNPVLEPGTDPGDSGSGTAPVRRNNEKYYKDVEETWRLFAI